MHATGSVEETTEVTLVGSEAHVVTAAVAGTGGGGASPVFKKVVKAEKTKGGGAAVGLHSNNT